MLGKVFFRPLAELMNRGIDRSTTAQRIAGELDGRCIGIEIDYTPVRIVLGVTGGRMVVGEPTPELALDAFVRTNLGGVGALLEADAEGPV